MNIKRSFIVGEEWLYFKIYTGEKYAEEILTGYIYPLCCKLLNLKLIDKWFFIRYHDPDSHLRLRFHIKSGLYKEVIDLFTDKLSILIAEKLIYNISVNTYRREIERYGEKNIELTESLFYFDSVTVCEILSVMKGPDLENDRWKFALSAINELLNDFEFSTDEKFEFFNNVIEYYFKETKSNVNLKKQLDLKFRKKRNEINELFYRSERQNNFIDVIQMKLKEKSKLSKKIIQMMYDHKKLDEYEISKDNFLKSLIHMMLNRIFIAHSPSNELVIYYLIYKFFRSDIARKKLDHQ